MTGRERLHRILNREPVDRLSWTTLVDATTTSQMPEPERAMMQLDFCERIGCDIMQFGNFGLPASICVHSPARAVWPEHQVEKATGSDGTVTVATKTPWGTLTSVRRNGRLVKYPIESLADVRAGTEFRRHMRYEDAPNVEESFRRADSAIGDRGLYFPTTAPSPVQELIEEQMGLATFYYLLHDHTEEVEELLAVMHSRRLEEYDLLTRRTPAEAIIPVENTSSTLTSPAIYERYSLPQLRDYIAVAHAHGKKVILHMCGLLRNLLPVIRRTGLDGYNAMTPPTIGDTPFEYALDVLGDDVVIIGGFLSGNVFQKPGVTKDEIWRALDELYTPRIRRAHLVLCLQADGIPTPLERFLAVRDWMEKYGRQ